MNILDYSLLSIMAISVLFGAYSGLITTTLNTLAFFISWLLSALIYPIVTNLILSNEQVMRTIGIYTEGAANIPSHETARTAIDTLTPEQAEGMIEQLNIAPPLNAMLKNNILSSAFESDGLQTVAQYYDTTLFNVTIDILSFLITLTAVFFVLTMLIATIQYVVKFPQLKMLDGLAGAMVGLFRGVYVLYALFLLAPIVLSILPAELAASILQQSVFSSLFYPDNPMFAAIGGSV